MTALPEDSAAALWTFAVDVYGRAGVSEACLELQDDHGADVPVLLFALWLAARGVALDASDMTRVEATVGPWRAEVVHPLRVLRRQLKDGPPPAPGPRTEDLRNAIKAAELSSEKIELAQLARLADEGGIGRAGGARLEENLAVAAAFFAGGASVPAPLLKRLASAAQQD